MGTILTRNNDKGEYSVLSYVSRKLQKHKRNYIPFLLEMQAIMWGTGHPSMYLWGQPFNAIH